MAQLVIDVGNSRLKWGLVERGALTLQDATTLETLATNDLPRDARIERALVANVAGDVAAARVREVLRPLTSQILFLQSTRHAHGVTNGYTVPERLGVDRWVAMIGAHALYPGALCIASVGTAMTLDALDPSGQHLGGLIVPGPHLMVDSLFRGTSDIQKRAVGGERNHDLLAIDTLGAVTQGAERALAALVDRVVSGVEQRVGRPVRLLVSGGASIQIEHLIEHSFVGVPDLVLRGLAEIASSS